MAKPLIVDNGLFTSLAQRIGRDTEVAYFSSWGNAFPQSREVAPGTGLPNVERIDDPVTFMLEGRASNVIVPDLYLTGYENLAKTMEIPCFGAGEGARLETDRWLLKEFLEERGLPVINAVECIGLDNLRLYLEKHDDRYVKVSVFRGDLETYHHVDWPSTSVWFDDLARRLGPLGALMRFIVEDPIPDAEEPGMDMFFIDNSFLMPTVVGFEDKDSRYLGRITDRIPKMFAPAIEAFTEYFSAHEYRNFFSFEARTRQGQVFVTDATCRIPSPPGAGLMTAMRNLTAIVTGESTKPDPGDTVWIAEIVLKSDWVGEHFLQVDVPPSLREYVGFHNHCEIDGRTWIIPHDSKMVEFGSAVGISSSSPEDAGKMALEVAKAIKAYRLTFDDSDFDDSIELFATSKI